MIRDAPAETAHSGNVGIEIECNQATMGPRVVVKRVWVAQVAVPGVPSIKESAVRLTVRHGVVLELRSGERNADAQCDDDERVHDTRCPSKTQINLPYEASRKVRISMVS